MNKWPPSHRHPHLVEAALQANAPPDDDPDELLEDGEFPSVLVAELARAAEFAEQQAVRIEVLEKALADLQAAPPSAGAVPLETADPAVSE